MTGLSPIPQESEREIDASSKEVEKPHYPHHDLVRVFDQPARSLSEVYSS
jgi:hypothetical protein